MQCLVVPTNYSSCSSESLQILGSKGSEKSTTLRSSEPSGHHLYWWRIVNRRTCKSVAGLLLRAFAIQTSQMIYFKLAEDDDPMRCEEY